MAKKLVIAICSFVILGILSSSGFAASNPSSDPSSFCPSENKLVYIPIIVSPIIYSHGAIIGIKCNTINGDCAGDLKTKIKFLNILPMLARLPLIRTPYHKIPYSSKIGHAHLITGIRNVSGNRVIVLCLYSYPKAFNPLLPEIVLLKGTTTIS